MREIITTGNKGKTVRSDCFVTFDLKDSGGLDILLESKVEVMYGNANRKLAKEVLNFFGIQNASLKIVDSGALPLVLTARIEAAIKKLVPSDKEFLPDLLQENQYTTKNDRNRFSRLYLPGNSPSLMINAGIHHPDGIILDLEDAVAPDKKDEARYLVRNALRGIDFYGAERMVRINQGERGLDDLEWLIPHNVNLILLPKCENPEQIKDINKRMDSISKKNKRQDPVWIMPIIESALGVMNAFTIAGAAENIVSLAIGL